VAFAAIYNTTVTSGFAQIGAHAALTTSDDGVADAVREWQARRDLIVQELEGLPVVVPDGGWSLLIDAEALGMGAPDLSASLMDRGRLAGTPRTGWGWGGAPASWVARRRPPHTPPGCPDRAARQAPRHRRACARRVVTPRPWILSLSA